MNSTMIYNIIKKSRSKSGGIEREREREEIYIWIACSYEILLQMINNYYCFVVMGHYLIGQCDDWKWYY